MPLYGSVLAMIIGAAGTLVFSTLTYSLRDLSRGRLSEFLQRHRRQRLIDPIVEHRVELVYATAVCRLVANTLVALAAVWICQQRIPRNMLVRDLVIFFLAVVVTLVFSVALPQALTKYMGNELVGASAGLLNVLRVMLKPLAFVMHLSDRFVRSAAGEPARPQPEELEQQIEEDILSAVEEGEEQGVVDEQEREMIESVIEFHDATAAHVMTARTEIVALDARSTLAQVRQTIEESGHSRIPVFDGTLDQIIGIVYARDLIRFVGQSPEGFDLRTAIRAAFFVPETTRLADLLHDFRRRKVHIAIVLDEYGGTTGLVTIEDILEQLVGDISDEHEPVEPSVFRRIDDRTVEVDARIEIHELNRLTSLSLSEDEDYSTLGGFVLATLGRIPEKGTVFEHRASKFTILEAEPQRVLRVRIEQVPQPAEPQTSGKT